MPLDIQKIRKWVDSCDSVTEAARRLDIRPENLHRLLRGECDGIRLYNLERMADVIGVEVGELIRRAKIV